MHLSRKHIIIIISATVGVLLLGVLLWHYFPALRLLKQPTFDRATFIREFRGRGPLAAVPIALLLAAVSLIPGAPNSVIAIVSGICLGAPLGFVVNVVGLTIGNALGALLVSRIAELRKQQKPSRILDDLLKMRHPKLGIALGYSVPFVPNTLVHIAAADLKINRQTLLGLIFAGSIPTAFFYAFGGDAVLHLNVKRLVFVAVLIAASAGVISLIRRDRKREKTN